MPTTTQTIPFGKSEVFFSWKGLAFILRWVLHLHTADQLPTTSPTPNMFVAMVSTGGCVDERDCGHGRSSGSDLVCGEKKVRSLDAED